MKKRSLILTALMLTLFAVNSKGLSMGSVKAKGIVDNAEWNKKTDVTITVLDNSKVNCDYLNYRNIGSDKYTLDSIGVWQWGAKTSDGRYSVYFDAADIKQVANLYENIINVPARYKANCALREATERELQ